MMKRIMLVLLALLCLGTAVTTNLGGTYMLRGIINDFIYNRLHFNS